MDTKTKFLLSLLVLTFLIDACSPEDPIPPVTHPTNTSTVTTPTNVWRIPDPPKVEWDFEEDVYIAGGSYSKQKDIAQLWGNSKLQLITDGKIDAIATSIYVYGDDVFLAGYEYNWDVYNGWYRFPNKAMIWKNGVPQALTNGNNEAGSSSIFVWNEDVYVAGYESNGDHSVAMLWKNGEPIPLSDGAVPTEATSVFISNGDVYVVGNADFNKAILWKNGVPQYLSGGSAATAVFVSGNDVYVAGYGTGAPISAMLWKNGVLQMISSSYSYASSVYVTGEDIYVAGSEVTQNGENSYGPTKAIVWKNGAPKPLTNGSQNGSARSIAGSGDDLYVVGSIGDQAVIWKNDVAKSLGKFSEATGLFIRK